VLWELFHISNERTLLLRWYNGCEGCLEAADREMPQKRLDRLMRSIRYFLAMTDVWQPKKNSAVDWNSDSAITDGRSFGFNGQGFDLNQLILRYGWRCQA